MDKVKAFLAANKLAIYAGLALLLGVVLLLAYCQGRSDGKTGEVVHEQAREIQVQNQLGAAAAGASETRVADAVRSAHQEQELTNALNASTDPDRRRQLRGCVVMQQQGRDTSGIPACR